MTDVEEAPDTAEFTSEGYTGAYRATFEFTANLLAACPTFREGIVGAASDAEAKQKVYPQETYAEANDEEVGAREGDPPPELEPRPYAVVIDDQRTQIRSGVGEWSGSGSVVVVIEMPVPSEFAVDYDQDDSAVRRDKFRRQRLWRIDLVSTLEAELMELSGDSDAAGNPYLNVTDVELIVPPGDQAADISDPAFIGFAFRLKWR